MVATADVVVEVVFRRQGSAYPKLFELDPKKITNVTTKYMTNQKLTKAQISKIKDAKYQLNFHKKGFQMILEAFFIIF